jgi:hypothetical protein
MTDPRRHPAQADTDTWHEEVDFWLTSHASGDPWIVIDCPRGPQLPILNGGFLGLEFQPGTSNEEALEIASLLSEHVRFVTYTGPIQPAFADQPGRGAIARRRSKKSI